MHFLDHTLRDTDHQHSQAQGVLELKIQTMKTRPIVNTSHFLTALPYRMNTWTRPYLVLVLHNGRVNLFSRIVRRTVRRESHVQLRGVAVLRRVHHREHVDVLLAVIERDRQLRPQNIRLVFALLQCNVRD